MAVNLRKLGVVARFELGEALRSRLVVVILSLYGAGAALGAYVFAKALGAAESAARSALADSMNAHDIPDDLVRREALPRVISAFVDDPSLREELSRIDPLALFYGLMALYLVAPLVLITSGGAHAMDLARGATRFVLTRCDRLSWALGKMLGHAALLATGLFTGALVTAAVATGQGRFDAGSLFWLLRAAFRAWVYGFAYLGIFTAVALLVRAPARARAMSVLVLFGLWLGHGLAGSAWLNARLPFVDLLVWIFPGHYDLLLWSPSWLTSLPAMFALLSIGGAAFALGHTVFARGDA
jgi:ABC-type transport system involved in multi-copper enzyme maturation permease subunit